MNNYSTMIRWLAREIDLENELGPIERREMARVEEIEYALDLVKQGPIYRD